MKELTIITPTYNREKTLPAVYNSLFKQTIKSFIWLVIDDGSTDKTEALIKEYADAADFEIRYYKKENGGKARALNFSLDLIDTPYTVCLDSDDTFAPDAVEKSLQLLHNESNNENCCGIIGLRNNLDGTVMGGKEIPKSYKYTTIVEIYNDCNISSEFITFYKTDILKSCRFPEIEGEKFMPPSWVHYSLCEKYKFRTTWDILCYCEYMGDGLTRNKRKVVVKNPKGYTLIKKVSFKYSKGLKRKFKNAIMYDCGCIIGKDKQWLKNAPYKCIALLSFPLGFAVYQIRFKKLIKGQIRRVK